MKEDTRKMILDVARDLAERYGFWSFRVDDILRHAHISRATFYKYFRNRQDVLFTLFDNRLDEIESEMRTAVSGVTGSYDRLQAFMKLRIAGITSLFTSLNIRIGETDASPMIPRERIKRQNEKDLAIVREILADGKGRGDLVFDDLSLTARAVLGIVREIELNAVFENKDTRTIEREIEAMLGALFYGISEGTGGKTSTQLG